MTTIEAGLRVARLAPGLALLWALPASAQVSDSEIHLFALFDQLEVAPADDGPPVTLDATGWLGGDVNRLWARAEAELETADGAGDLQAEALYGRLVAPYWDALVGVRVDRRWGEGGETRAHLALGLQGLAPLWFEVEPTIYVSHEGHVSGQLEAEYDLLVTQRLVFQPRGETQLALQSDEEMGVGSGFTDLELGARLRYEIVRELAPYVGLVWHQRFGETADFARAAGEDTSILSFVVGLRAWY